MAVAGGRCLEHEVKPWERKSANSNALTRAERIAFRAKVLEAAGNVCATCGGEATEADHVLEIADGGDPWDWRGNGQALCPPCHLDKTNAARRARFERRREQAERAKAYRAL